MTTTMSKEFAARNLRGEVVKLTDHIYCTPAFLRCLPAELQAALAEASAAYLRLSNQPKDATP